MKPHGREEQTQILPSDVAKFLLIRAERDGSLISPLKMQKLVYYAYVQHLVEHDEKLFEEPVEAWPMGPVVPSLYGELKKYGSGPIETLDYTKISSPEEVDSFLGKIPQRVRETLDKTYEEYETLTAFELVMLTHQEKAWLEARKGLSTDESSNNPLQDQYVLEQHRDQ